MPTEKEIARQMHRILQLRFCLFASRFAAMSVAIATLKGETVAGTVVVFLVMILLSLLNLQYVGWVVSNAFCPRLATSIQYFVVQSNGADRAAVTPTRTPPPLFSREVP